MVSRLDTQDKIVGVKQVKRALDSKEVAIVYIAEDADGKLIDEVVGLCQDHEVQVIMVKTMEDLGEACGIDVNAATAALLKELS